MTTTASALPARTKGCCMPLADPLPDRDAQATAAALKAAADPTRVQMLHMLREAGGPVCVCDFTAVFDLGQPTVSHHLSRLRAAGFVTSTRQGVWSHWTLREDMPDAARRALTVIP
jgi:ArsR family transcriptional regulator, arsenate/arsenite/antimonite-responsive transcriptional repressor